MADMTLNLSTGILTWSAFGEWEAVSGPHTPGPLPIGLYKVSRRELTEYTKHIGKPFKDKTGKGFFVPIYPKFKTTRGTKGGRLGIHPDGNVPGTNGCVGLKAPDTSSFYNALGSTAPSAVIILEVIK